jgi:hypothetical protein
MNFKLSHYRPARFPPRDNSNCRCPAHSALPSSTGSPPDHDHRQLGHPSWLLMPAPARCLRGPLFPSPRLQLARPPGQIGSTVAQQHAIAGCQYAEELPSRRGRAERRVRSLGLTRKYAGVKIQKRAGGVKTGRVHAFIIGSPFSDGNIHSGRNALYMHHDSVRMSIAKQAKKCNKNHRCLILSHGYLVSAGPCLDCWAAETHISLARLLARRLMCWLGRASENGCAYAIFDIFCDHESNGQTLGLAPWGS